MAESTELLIIVRAKDLASKVFSTVLGTAKLFGKSLTGIFSGLGNIFFSLKTALIGFLSAAAFKRVVDEVSDLVDASDRLGLSFRTLQGLSLAAALGGSSRQELLVGVKNLARLLEEARNGGEQARETFARLGIDWNAAAGEAGELNTYLEAVATRFSEMQNGAQKAATAQALFGRSGLALIPVLNEGAEGLEKARLAADELGITLTDKVAREFEAFGDEMVKTKEAIKGVFIQALGRGTIQGALERLREFNKWIVENRELFSIWVAAVLQIFGTFFSFLRDRWNRYTGDHKKIWEDAGKIIQGFVTGALTVFGTMFRVIVLGAKHASEALVSEITGGLKGFSLTDAILGGDPFKERSKIQERVKFLSAHVIRLKEQLKEDLARSGGDVSLVTLGLPGGGQVEGTTEAGRAIIQAQFRAMAEETQKALTIAQEQLAAKMHELGLSTPEEFGKGFRTSWEQFVKDAQPEIVTAFSTLGDTVVNTLGEIGAKPFLDRILEIIKEAKSSTDALEAARNAAAAAGFTPEAAQEIGEEVGAAIGTGINTGARRVLAAPSSLSNQLKEVKVQLNDVGQSIVSNLADGIIALGERSRDALAIVRDTVKQIIKEIGRIALVKGLTSLLSSIFPSAATAASGAGGTGGGLSASSFAGLEGARGAVFPGHFQAFARGSPRVGRPTLGLIGEGTKPEAVIPLPDGRSVPVSLNGGGGGTINFTINVQAMDGESAARVLIAQAEVIKGIYLRALNSDASFLIGVKSRVRNAGAA